jgi:hypothetical protein
MTSRTWEDDAREFGVHVRQGGWRLGLLVARRVEPGTGQGENVGAKYPKSQTGQTDKVSASTFAKAAGTDQHRVMRYYRAWHAAAIAGLVPHPGDLQPSEDPPLDVERLPDWSEFYPPGDDHFLRKSPEERARLEAIAVEHGTTAAQITRVSSAPKAIAAALAANPELADTVLDDPAVQQHVTRAQIRHGQERIAEGHERARRANDDPAIAGINGSLSAMGARLALSRACIDFAEAVAANLPGAGELKGTELIMFPRTLDRAANALTALREWIESGTSPDDELAQILKDGDNS